MPTKQQREAVEQQIGWLRSMSYLLENGELVSGPVSDAVAPWWEDLNRAQQQAILAEYVNWSGFTEAQENSVIERVLDGQDAEFWFDGMEPGDFSRPDPPEAPGKETTYREIRDRLTERRQVAILWDAEDVRAVRPDLDAERAWQVLQRVEHEHDGDHGVTWDTIEDAADELFPPSPLLMPDARQADALADYRSTPESIANARAVLFAVREALPPDTQGWRDSQKLALEFVKQDDPAEYARFTRDEAAKSSFPTAGQVPSVADILADPTRYVAPGQPDDPGPEPGRSRGRSH